jgi:hypothetical protein
VGLSLFTLSHLPANANFLLLLFAFFLLFFCLNHAEPPLSCITSLWLYVPLVVVRLLAIQPLHEITKRRWTLFEKNMLVKMVGLSLRFNGLILIGSCTLLPHMKNRIP